MPFNYDRVIWKHLFEKQIFSFDSEGLSPVSSRDHSLTSRRNSVEESQILSAYASKRLDREFEKKLQEVFVSVQLEKVRCEIYNIDSMKKEKKKKGFITVW